MIERGTQTLAQRCISNRRTMASFLLFYFINLIVVALGQEGVRDDSHVKNVVKQAVADEFSSEILTNRTRAYLSCAQGEMMVKLNFSEPFRGVTYTDYDRTSPCSFHGDGRKYYELRIPLKGCGTRREAPRVFINNIIVRFHHSLELEEDEIKTIICRYPPPLAPPPANVAPVLVPTAGVPAIVPAKLSEVELLLIICALLFLTLLLLGIGIAYYCLKKRNIKVVKKRKAISSGPGSVMTKLSASTMDPMSMFDPIRIPRAMAQSTSGSEAALLTSMSSQNGSGERSDTIPSDYPSESPSSLNSDVEEMDGRRSMLISETSTVRNDHFRYENTAFIPDDAGSERSGYPEDVEKAQSLSSIPIATLVRPPEMKPLPPVAEPKKKMKAKLAKEQMLTTISEKEDALQREAYERRYASVVRAQEELYGPALKHVVEAPVYTRIRKRDPPPPPSMSSYAPSLYGSIPDNDNRSHSEFLEDVPTRGPRSISSYAPSIQGSIPDNDIWSHAEVESEAAVKSYVPPAPPAPPPPPPQLQTATVTDYYLTTQTTTDIQEDISRLRQTTLPQDVIPDVADHRSVSEFTAPVEMKAIVPRKPKITVQNIDDVYVTTTEEVHATETITKRTKDTIEQHMKSPTTPTWGDVAVQQYPPHQSPPPPPPPPPPPDYGDTVRTWDAYSEVSEKYRDAESTITEPAVRMQYPPHPPERSRPRLSPPCSPPPPPPPPLPPLTSHHYVSTIRRDVVDAVFHPPPTIEGVERLTEEVREKWRTVISTDSVFRTLVQEATTVEEFVRITRDVRYESLFDSRTWEVIIHVLVTSPPPVLNYPDHVEPRVPRYRKKSDHHEPRTRRPSLPPVHEFDAIDPKYGSIRSIRTSRSGSMPDFDHDMRSVTEVDVDFARADRESLWSVDTGYTYRTARSIAERSTSEFLEDVPTVSQRRDSRRFVEQAAAEVTTVSDIYHLETASEYSDLYRRHGPLPRRPVLERSSTEYIENVPTISLPEVYTTRPPGGDSRAERSRPVLERSSTEIIINSPIIRAIDRASSIGEREEIKSITETDIFDWKR